MTSRWHYEPVVYRSPKHRDRAHELTCIKCGNPGASLCHYTGPRQHHYGKGRSQKCSDLMGADLCDDCHHQYDNYAVSEIEHVCDYHNHTIETKKYLYSEEFQHYALLSIHRRLEYGDTLKFSKKYQSDEHFANV